MVPEHRAAMLSGQDHMSDAHVLAINLTGRSFQFCSTDPGELERHSIKLHRTLPQ